MDENQYGFNELRRLMMPTHHYQQQREEEEHYGMAMMGGEMGGMNAASSLPLHLNHHLPPLESAAMTTTTSTRIPGEHHRSMDVVYGALFEDNGSGYSQGRWPRQETLTLLEIRSRLDPKFKESAHKAPLWDEVSRMMTEEHGYQRSGKKCREKLENLYKYYKKTKEGRAGRQDGKHYRFFKQLDALYGSSEPRTTATIANATARDARIPLSSPDDHVLEPELQSEPPLPPNSCSELYTTSTSRSSSSSEEHSHRKRRRRRKGGGGWKEKMKEFVDEQVKKFMDMQESLWEKMIQALESKERERIWREEQWRKQESARLDLESKHLANERARIETRNKVLMEALDKATNIVITGAAAASSSRRPFRSHNDDDDDNNNNNITPTTAAGEEEEGGRRRWNEGSM